jgi:hypothetical protein
MALCVVLGAARSCLRLRDKRTSRGHRFSVAIDPHRHKGSRLRCAARFNDDAGTWYADLITIGRGEPNEAEGIHRPYRECGGAAAVSSPRRARRSLDASTDLAY